MEKMQDSKKTTAFTKNIIEKLACPADKEQIYYRDSQTRCLYIQAARGGTKSFVYRKSIDGSKRQKFLGYFPDISIEQARAAANKLNAAFGIGENPFDEFSASKNEMTFRDLFNIYIDRHARKQQKKTTDEMIKDFDRWLPSIAKRKPSTIMHIDAEQLHGQIAKQRGEYAANRAIQLARSVFNKAKQFKIYQGENPFSNLTLFSEEPRNRFLSTAEAARLINALQDGLHIDLHDFIMLDLMTGARKTNLLSMRWDEISDLNSMPVTWTIPETKNGTSQVVPLGADEIKILKRRRKNMSSPWVFPSKTSKSGHLEDLKRAWTTIRKQTKLTDITIHDLRRSLASAMASQNVNVALIQSALHHKDLKTTLGVYAKTSNQAVLEAKQSVHKLWFDEAKKERKKVVPLKKK
jgi:integrase